MKDHLETNADVELLNATVNACVEQDIHVYWFRWVSWMSYLRSLSVIKWTVRTIVSTLMVQCWVGMKRESFVREGTQHCQSSQMRISTTCFRSLYQKCLVKRNTETSMCGPMLTLVISTTLSNGIGSTDNLPASNRSTLFIGNFGFYWFYWTRTPKVHWHQRILIYRKWICFCGLIIK